MACSQSSVSDCGSFAPMLQKVVLVGLLTTAQPDCAVAVGVSVDVSLGGFLYDKQAPMATDVFTVTPYGKSTCPCVGIAHISGFYAANLDYYHIQYPLEAGSTCAAWDETTHPLCKEGDGPDWCYQKWCYVDPCNCETEGMPGVTQMGGEYHGGPAYFSYETCGQLNLYTKAMSPDACISQQNQTFCNKHEKCAWDGKRCGGKQVVNKCANDAAQYDPKYGQEDCRCVGLAGREPGRAFLNINDEERIHYSPDVGAYCHEWEAESHPDCNKEGVDMPAWCHSKWCFVDPCKCKTKSPPRIVMPANQALTFQGKTAYWSSQTCGSDDAWTASHGTHYCVSRQSEEECATMKKHCAWTGKECLGKALAGICQGQELSGILGFESGVSTSATALAWFIPALLLAFVA